MPLYEAAIERIRANLRKIEIGDRAPVIDIGFLTDSQFSEINQRRSQFDLHLLEQNEILFMGRHLYNSRHKDGYTIEDMIDQIASALSADATISVGPTWSRIDNTIPRLDAYGNYVRDRGVFEMTAKKPKAELFSVMPKGDTNKPIKTRKPT